MTVIHRCRLEGAPLRPGFWRWLDAGWAIAVACPLCAKERGLVLVYHTIDATGFVEPTSPCVGTACTFDEPITLDSFSAANKGAA